MKKHNSRTEIYYAKIQWGKNKPYWVEIVDEKINAYKGKVFDPSSRNYGKIVSFTPENIIGYHVIKLSKNGLGSPYIPASESCTILDTIVPDSMSYETHIAIRKIKEAVGGDLSGYVSGKLQYTNLQLCKALAAEQVDAVAMAIYNIEARGQGMIIGDQTGIGKGRVAAAMIRYGYMSGVQPIFMSEKPNLFSDIYRDLVDIGSSDLIPFIINSQESKTNIKDKDGNIVFQAPIVSVQTKIIASGKIPKNYDYVLCTYTQFNAIEPTAKKAFLQKIAQNNILIMDEAHNASGASNTGNFLQGIVADCKGVLFLSGTFAKRPDNMPIYAMKTCMKEANMSSDQLVEAITRGGVALQEILASQLVMEGQMLRRERSFDGVEVNFLTLDDLAQEHRAISDNITEIIREMIVFQRDYVNPEIEKMNKVAAAEGKQVKERGGTSQAGIKNSPYFSKVFNIFNQMLFSIKAEAVADRAVMRLREGKKPVIAFSSTMGSFLSEMKSEGGDFVGNGDLINADFKTVLQKGLDGLLRFTETDHAGHKTYKEFSISEFSQQAQSQYYGIVDKIKSASTGISISPIDIIIQKIEAAGFSVSEVTGRQLAVQFDQVKIDREAKTIAEKKIKDAEKTGIATTLGRVTSSTVGMVITRKKENVNDAFRRFNNNEIDVLLINQSGSTGASAHAVVTNSVKPNDVKQRCMIILQPELNISTEVQKRGRINRTGQLSLPIYDYISSAIPAEKRLVMMLQKKLKSLDANTTSNQNQSEQVLSVDDFLNKYGDKVVHGYLNEHLELNTLLNDPLELEKENKDGKDIPEDLAYKVSGRIAILSCQEQEDFYNAIIEQYKAEVDYLKQTGEYNLEVQTMNLEAETEQAKVCVAGTGGKSSFGSASVHEKCMCNVLKKPYTLTELQNILKDSLKDKTPQQHQADLCRDYKTFALDKMAKDVADIYEKYSRLIEEINQERGYKKIEAGNDANALIEFVKNRTNELQSARDGAIASEKEKANNRWKSMNNIFSYFLIGNGYKYPFMVYGGTDPVNIPAVFLGYNIDMGRANPYIPSNVKLRFALSDGHKYIALASSGDQGLQIRAIIGSSYNSGRLDFIAQWESLITKSSVSRKIRHIITGNLLQASALYKGNLISYTSMDGGVKKGILMPDNWNGENKRGETEVVLPISKAIKIILEMYPGETVSTMNGISFHRPPYGMSGRIEMSVPKTKAYAVYFQDQDIIALSSNPVDGFEMRSGRMLAYFEKENVNRLIDILQSRYSVSMKVNSENSDFNLDVDRVLISRKSPETQRAESQYADDRQKFEKRQFDANQIKQASRGGPMTDDAAIKAKAKAKARARFLFLSAQF